jgi:putative oxidoreductase
VLKHFGPLVARILLALIFLLSGFHKLMAFEHTAAYMAAHGLPAAHVLLVATIAIEFAGSLMILLGWQARLGAAALFLFLIPTTLVFHAFWAVNPADTVAVQNQMNHFMKNLAIMGGMLYVVVYGSGPLSLRRTR